MPCGFCPNIKPDVARCDHGSANSPAHSYWWGKAPMRVLIVLVVVFEQLSFVHMALDHMVLSCSCPCLLVSNSHTLSVLTLFFSHTLPLFFLSFSFILLSPLFYPPPLIDELLEGFSTLGIYSYSRLKWVCILFFFPFQFFIAVLKSEKIHHKSAFNRSGLGAAQYSSLLSRPSRSPISDLPQDNRVSLKKFGL